MKKCNCPTERICPIHHAPAVQRETGAVAWLFVARSPRGALSKLGWRDECDAWLAALGPLSDDVTVEKKPLYAAPPTADRGELLREYDEWRSKPVVYTEEKNDWLKRLAAALRGMGR